MARKVRDSALETRTARSRLKVAHKPYYRLIEPGLHLGYRKLASGPGTWIVRRYSGAGKYAVKNLFTADERPIVADDFSEPDGKTVLSFGQAQERAKTHRPNDAGDHAGPYTVAGALNDYFAFLESEGRSKHSIDDARYRAAADITPKLGAIELSRLTTEKLRRWRDDVVGQAPRLRTKDGEKQKYREVEGDDALRARRASTNRVWNTLRAALNHAFRDGKVSTDIAWRKVKPFRGVGKARVRYLDVAEAKQLAAAIEAEFRPMVQAALLTGGRYGQLAHLAVADFNADAGTVRMTTRKGDGTQKSYYVHLTNEGVRFFKRACGGRDDAKATIFVKSNGGAWRKSDQARPMVEASAQAKITPPVNFHCLRHTYASHAVMNGVPLLVVAKNLGHSDTRMVEQHYGHLAPSYIADAIRAGAPQFGFKAERGAR